MLVHLIGGIIRVGDDNVWSEYFREGLEQLANYYHRLKSKQL